MPFTLLVVAAFLAALILKWRPVPATYLLIAVAAAGATVYFLR